MAAATIWAVNDRADINDMDIQMECTEAASITAFMPVVPSFKQGIEYSHITAIQQFAIPKYRILFF
ncbi:MAG: hypothetical protein A3H25_02275 [Sphingomonadales bacterium RIFCSPLOWO2_12_FULL_63_15]|nr:MAG: hypothetical protein A3H25_02275 [Sphingomonadales bacterium RIFCSPLOWO2_12_FULL_63_15]